MDYGNRCLFLVFYASKTIFMFLNKFQKAAAHLLSRVFLQIHFYYIDQKIIKQQEQQQQLQQQLHNSNILIYKKSVKLWNIYLAINMGYVLKPYTFLQNCQILFDKNVGTCNETDRTVLMHGCVKTIIALSFFLLFHLNKFVCVNFRHFINFRDH